MNFDMRRLKYSWDVTFKYFIDTVLKCLMFLGLLQK